MAQLLRDIDITDSTSPLLDRTLDILFKIGKGEDPRAQKQFRVFLKKFLPTPELQNLFAKYVLLKLASEIKGKGVETLSKALADSVENLMMALVDSLVPNLAEFAGLNMMFNPLIEGTSRKLIDLSVNYGMEYLNSALANSIMEELILKPFAEFGHAMEINPYFRLQDKKIDPMGVRMIANSSAGVLLASPARDATRIIRANDAVKFFAISIALGSQLIQFFQKNKNQDISDNDVNAKDNPSSAGSGLLTALVLHIALRITAHLWTKYGIAAHLNEIKIKKFSKSITDNPSAFFGISYSGRRHWLSCWSNEELSKKSDTRGENFRQLNLVLEGFAAFHPNFTNLNEAIKGITDLLKPDNKDISNRLEAPIHKTYVQYLALLHEYKSYKDNPSFHIRNDPNAKGIEFKNICIVVDVNRPNTPIDPDTGTFTKSLNDIVSEATSGRDEHSFTFPKGTCTLCVGTNNLGKSMLRRFMMGGYVIGKGEMVLPTKEENGDKFANVRVFTHEPFFGPGVSLRENILINSGSSEQDRKEDLEALDCFNETIDSHLGNKGFGKVLDQEYGHGKLSLGTKQIASICSAYIAAVRAARKNEHIVIILDEACNGLNMAPSEVLQELFEPFKPHMTSFQIAHSNENLIIKPDRLFELPKLTLVEQEKCPLTQEDLSKRKAALAKEIKKRGLSQVPTIPVKVTTPHQERTELLEEHRGIAPPRRSERIRNRNQTGNE